MIAQFLGKMVEIHQGVRMPYLIDGHNLIPKIRGMSLSAMDDEQQLIELLQEFCRIQRQSVEVFFDQAPPAKSGARKYGMVTAHFIRQGKTADDAIRDRLHQLGKGARNWKVVSSDRQVQAQARALLSTVISSEAFALALAESQRAAPQKDNRPEPGKLSDEEVAAWLEEFKNKKPRQD